MLQKESQSSRNESKASLHQDVKIIGEIALHTKLRVSMLFVALVSYRETQKHSHSVLCFLP